MTTSMISWPEQSAAADGHAWHCPDAMARWHILHVKSRQEKALASDLEQAGIVHYLPLNTSVRYYGRRKANVIEPLFPGYLFLKGDRDQAFRADRTRRVASILPVHDQAKLEAELGQLRTTLEHVGYLAPTSLLKVGASVEVVAGPFKGMVGRIDTVDGRNRLVLHVTALGQGAALEIDGSLVRPLEH